LNVCRSNLLDERQPAAGLGGQQRGRTRAEEHGEEPVLPGEKGYRGQKNPGTVGQKQEGVRKETGIVRWLLPLEDDGVHGVVDDELKPDHGKTDPGCDRREYGADDYNRPGDLLIMWRSMWLTS